MTDLLAALGLSQLHRLESIVAERNRQFQRYKELLSSLPVRLLNVPEDVLSSIHLAVIRLVEGTPNNHRQVFEGTFFTYRCSAALQSCSPSALLSKVGFW